MMAVSTAEDILTGGLLVLAYAYPVVAGGVALMLLALDHLAAAARPQGAEPAVRRMGRPVP